MELHIGDRGEAVTPLAPQGLVQVNGRRLDARAEFGTIDAGTAVVVLRGDPAGLVVRAVTPGTELFPLPGQGERVFASFGEVREHVTRREEAAARRERALRRRVTPQYGATFGATAAIVVICFLWHEVIAQDDLPTVVALVTVAGGALWGWGVSAWADHGLQRLGDTFYHVAAGATVLALAGAAAAAILVIPRFGVIEGLVAAALATLVLGALLPGLSLFAEPPAEG
jgi:hypothetical protein